MADPNAASETRILTLRRRWEADRTSSAFLPLAEEYRRLGRFSEAIDTLEAGLRLQPSYLSAQVALGRCRLESGDAAGAGAVLERVLATDPTQLVANKLMVEAYLRSGEPRRALARLDAYAALNDRDPDLPPLRQRILVALAGSSSAAEIPAVRAADGPPAPVAASEISDDDLFVLPMAVSPPDLSALWPHAFPEPAVRAREPQPATASAAPSGNGAKGEQELFPGLSGPEAVTRYLSGLLGGGMFAPPAAERASAALPDWQPAAAPEAEPELDAFAAALPEPVPAEEPVADSPWLGSTVVANEPESSIESAEPSADATVTLGTLYLGQGHLSEAAEIFNAVLGREPENVAARQGLELAGLADDAHSAQMPPPEGVTARKVRVLRTYLTNLRQEAPGDVP